MVDCCMTFSRSQQVLGALVRFCARRPLLVLLLALGVTAIAGRQAVQITIDTDLANLLPSEYPSARAIERLREAVGAESTVDLAIESPSFEANRAFAEALVPKAMALRQDGSEDAYFTRVDYRRDLEFLRRRALYFATPAELDTLEAVLVEQRRRVRALADGQSPPHTQGPSLSADALFDSLGLKEYPISADSTVLALRFYPTGSQTDVGYIEALYENLDGLVRDMAPASYHPEMTVTTAGRLLRQQVEIRAITDDVQRSFGAGVGAVLFVVLLYFLVKALRGGALSGQRVLVELARTPVLALVLATPLLMSLIGAGGIAAAAFGSLNLMTSTLGLVLFGLGIDYGIHFLARYIEERHAGSTVSDAAYATGASTGTAILVSGVTTAISLFVLILADFRGFSEFGWIGGCGIVLGTVAMLLVLPAMLGIAERLHLLNYEREEKGLADEEGTVRPPASFQLPTARVGVGLGVALSILALVFMPSEPFEYDFGKLDPSYPDYEARAARVKPVYDTEGRLRNPAYLLLDSAQDVTYATSALRRLEREDSLILTVLSLQERFPTDSVLVQRKLDRLAELRQHLEDPFLQLDTTGALTRLRDALSITEPIPLDSVPDFLTRPFTTKDGEIGNFVLVYPSASLSDGRRSMRFANLVGQVQAPDGTTYQAASTSIVAADMLRLMLAEAPRMVLITAVFIVVLMLLTFRSVRWAVLAVLPLVIGALWMLLVMEITGITFTFYNLVVLPAILGIGNDAGVHLVHRYREEGPGSMKRVLRSTGEHVGMGALTTLIGFAGLLLSFHPGLRSIGMLAAIGISTTMLAALVFLPLLIRLLEAQGWLHPDGDAVP